MKKILAVTTNPAVIQTVRAACTKYAVYFDAEFCSETEEAESFINYELPEIKVLDFTSSDIDCHKIIKMIDDDPWLHNGGIIAVVPKPADVQEIEDKKNPNILIVQTERAFKEHFSRLLKILWSNQQFLFNRGMQEHIGGRETGSFICENDPLDIRMYTNIIVSYLYSTSRISESDRFALQTALMELLTNALEHGNCEITYQQKTQYLLSGGNILDLIAEKNKNPRIAARKIQTSYLITKDKSYFKIIDNGNGFDWKTQLQKKTEMESTHGRGINLSADLVQNLTYNDKGNEVSFEIANLQNKSNTIPGVMESFEMILYTDKQVICRQNEPTNDLFFIVSGRYAVYSERKLISILTTNDMFIGEMSFLLNDRRSATILAVGNCRLVRIPKTAFLNLIRKHPHYGIFLSKLLAQRLVRQTKQTLSLSTEIAELKSKLNIPETI